MTQMTKVEFKYLVKGIDTQDIGVLTRWLKKEALPRFQNDFALAISTIHMAVMDIKETSPLTTNGKIYDIGKKNAPLAEAICCAQPKPKN